MAASLANPPANQHDIVLPYIPPRTSSHAHHRQSSSLSQSQANTVFLDDPAPILPGLAPTPGPSSPTRDAAAHKRMSSTQTEQERSGLVERTLSSDSASGSSARAGSTRFPFKAKSAYFPSAHTEFQSAITGPPAPVQSETAREKRASQIAMSPPRQSQSRTKSMSNPLTGERAPDSSGSGNGSGKEKAAVMGGGNGPFEPPRTFGDKFIDGAKTTWTAEKERILLGPFDYLYGHPGKDIRSQLISAFNCWLKVPEESLAIITKVVGMLHTASLLVDDVEDSSLLRRGNPVAHSIFGTAQTINSANYVYFLALQHLTALPHANFAIQIFTEELLMLHRGQGMDLFWRDTLTCPSEDDYLEMVSNKTGGLFRLAIKLMQAESPVALHGNVDCVPLVTTIGLLFQILDDLLNLSSPTYTQRKGLCEDLTEGKFSFPVIHAIRADPENRVLINILKQKTEDEQVKRYAVSYMEGVGSFDYTKKVLAVLEGKAMTLTRESEALVGGEDGRRGGEKIKGILGMLRQL